MLVEPLERAGVRPQRDRRAGVERAIGRAHVPARCHPRLRLRDAPVGQVEIRVVAAGDPGFTALAEAVLDVAPRVAVALASLSDGVELPDLLPGRRVVGADLAPFRTEPFAAGQSLQHFPVDDDRSARVGESLFPIRY